jgi:hypothetical protein
MGALEGFGMTGEKRLFGAEKREKTPDFIGRSRLVNNSWIKVNMLS